MPCAAAAAGHHVCLDESVVRRSAGKQQSRSDATLILPHPFGDTRELLRRRIAVPIGGVTEHNDRIEMIATGIRDRARAGERSQPNPPE